MGWRPLPPPAHVPTARSRQGPPRSAFGAGRRRLLTTRRGHWANDCPHGQGILAGIGHRPIARRSSTVAVSIATVPSPPTTAAATAKSRKLRFACGSGDQSNARFRQTAAKYRATSPNTMPDGLRVSMPKMKRRTPDANAQRRVLLTYSLSSTGSNMFAAYDDAYNRQRSAFHPGRRSRRLLSARHPGSKCSGAWGV